MRKTYTLNVAGVTRELPLCPVNEKLDIAAFVMFSDVELTVACAEALLKKVPEFDIIVTAEAKGIPLAYEMSRQSGKRYIPARKGDQHRRQPACTGNACKQEQGHGCGARGCAGGRRRGRP